MNDIMINILTNYFVEHFGLIGKDGFLIDLDNEDMSRDIFIKIYNRSMSEVKEFRYRVLINSEYFAKFIFEIFYMTTDEYDLDTVYKYFVNVIQLLHDKLKTCKIKYL